MIVKPKNFFNRDLPSGNFDRFFGQRPAAPAPLVPPVIIVVGAGQGADGALTYPMPIGYQEDDVGLFLVETANEAVDCDGWAPLAAYGAGAAGAADATRLTVFWKGLAASEPDPVTSDSGDHQYGRMLIVRGSGTPVVLNGICDSVAANPMSIPVADTPADQCRVLHVVTSPEDLDTDHMSFWSSPGLTGIREEFDGRALSCFSGVKATAGSLGAVSAQTSRTLPQITVRATIAFPPGSV